MPILSQISFLCQILFICRYMQWDSQNCDQKDDCLTQVMILKTPMKHWNCLVYTFHIETNFHTYTGKTICYKTRSNTQKVAFFDFNFLINIYLGPTEGPRQLPVFSSEDLSVEEKFASIILETFLYKQSFHLG